MSVEGFYGVDLKYDLAINEILKTARENVT